ncbi:hypothetical protein [Spiroplasma endosymbiont of Cantharis lateralis]|uniref:hypothetical protein n=1 Tax=Spiroplasma endosymbiont of Cantharis lateralis TaxID=3066277 RepID=UPI00313DA6C5
MKKLTIYSSLLATIIPSTLAISCTPDFIREPNFIAIPSKVVKQVYIDTIKDFENYLIESSGDDTNPKTDFYSIKNHLRNFDGVEFLIEKFNYFFQKNKFASLRNIKYREDDIVLKVAKREKNYNCLTIEGNVCSSDNIYSLDENKLKIGDYQIGNFSVTMSSKKSDVFSYSKEIVYPIKNYWIDKKTIFKLWIDHNLINQPKVDYVLRGDDKYAIPNFEGLQPENYFLQDQLNFITKMEDIFGNWYWDMKKTDSFIYKKMSNNFIDITPYDSKYNFKNFHEKNPKVGFCEITAPVNIEVDRLHYCGQFEDYKNKLINLVGKPESPELEIYINVKLNPDFLGILDPTITEFNYKFYFGSFTKVAEHFYLYSF